MKAVQQAAGKRYETFYTAGQSANLYDMKNIVAVDTWWCRVVAVIAILIVLVVTFRSAALPLILLLTIESGIWINLSIPYFTGDAVNFIGYLVINTVAVGATIDYAILLTRTTCAIARSCRRDRRCFALWAAPSPRSWVSAGILATAGFALAFSSTLSAVASLGLLLARGAILSFALVTCFLPALLVLLDGAIRRTTWRADFAPARTSDLPANEGGAS